jgi:hypothetical protein
MAQTNVPEPVRMLILLVNPHQIAHWMTGLAKIMLVPQVEFG